MTTIDDALAVARRHGLHLVADAATAIEAGLDFRVVLAADESGQEWVLRVPRRADVSEGMAVEARILDLVRPALAAEDVAVPDWQVQDAELIAYPALPGEPGLTLGEDGQPIWAMDPASSDYARRLGRLLARLHAIDPEQARTAGVEVRTAVEVRASWQRDIDRVQGAFTVAPHLAEAWEAWLADDSSWPQRTVMTHGEIYPAHVLLGPDGAFTGVLDWTTARVDDPARDLSAQYGAAGEAMLRLAIEAYAEAGGTAHDGLAAQAARLWDAAPIGYALYALTTGAEDDRRAAAALLDPQG